MPSKYMETFAVSIYKEDVEDIVHLLGSRPNNKFLRACVEYIMSKPAAQKDVLKKLEDISYRKVKRK